MAVLPVFFAVSHFWQFDALIRHKAVGGLHKSADAHKIEAARVVNRRVWVDGHVVVGGPFDGDVVVAVFEHHGTNAAARFLRVFFPGDGANELVLAIRVATNVEPAHIVAGVNFFQFGVQGHLEGGEVVAHDPTKHRRGAGIAFVVGSEFDEGLLHFAVVVLADEVQVDAGGGHQRAFFGFGAAVGVGDGGLAVPTHAEVGHSGVATREGAVGGQGQLPDARRCVVLGGRGQNVVGGFIRFFQLDDVDFFVEQAGFAKKGFENKKNGCHDDSGENQSGESGKACHGNDSNDLYC